MNFSINRWPKFFYKIRLLWMKKKLLSATPHIEMGKKKWNCCKKLIIMPGDPLRAEHVAYKYLKNL